MEAVAEAERAARQVTAWSSARLTFERIDGGITNRNVKVTVDGAASYMFRFPGERTELLGIDRAGEIEASYRAADLGIGPPVFGELPGVGTLITGFVDGVHADFTADRIEAVIRLVKRLHGGGELAHHFPIFRVVERHARDAAAHGGTVPQGYDRLAVRAREIERAFDAAPDPPVPCHNDLLPANVLFGRERAWLLDFEYAGMNDRYFDLGNLSVNSRFDDSADDLLLATYFDSVGPRERARLALMKVMSELREGMWGVVQKSISTLTNVDFGDYAAERLGNCRRLSEARDFDALLEAAASPR